MTKFPPPPKDLTPSPQKKPSGGFKKMRYTAQFLSAGRIPLYECAISHNFSLSNEILWRENKNALFHIIFRLSKETLWRFKKNALYRIIFIGWKNSSRELIKMRYFTQFFNKEINLPLPDTRCSILCRTTHFFMRNSTQFNSLEREKLCSC